MSCVALLKVVLRRPPESFACAPLTKLLPVIVRVKFPPLTVEGEMLFKIGVGLSTVTVALALAVVSATLVAVTVTVFGFGKACGATYIPAELIVPAVEFPPARPFTDQVTEVLLVPVTDAVNGCPAPARTLALVGAIDTATPGAGFFLRSAVLVPLVLAQPATQTVAIRQRIWVRRRTVVLPGRLSNIEYASAFLA